MNEWMMCKHKHTHTHTRIFFHSRCTHIWIFAFWSMMMMIVKIGRLIKLMILIMITRVNFFLFLTSMHLISMMMMRKIIRNKEQRRKKNYCCWKPRFYFDSIRFDSIQFDSNRLYRLLPPSLSPITSFFFYSHTYLTRSSPLPCYHYYYYHLIMNH